MATNLRPGRASKDPLVVKRLVLDLALFKMDTRAFDPGVSISEEDRCFLVCKGFPSSMTEAEILSSLKAFFEAGSFASVVDVGKGGVIMMVSAPTKDMVMSKNAGGHSIDGHQIQFGYVYPVDEDVRAAVSRMETSVAPMDVVEPPSPSQPVPAVLPRTYAAAVSPGRASPFRATECMSEVAPDPVQPPRGQLRSLVVKDPGRRFPCKLFLQMVTVNFPQVGITGFRDLSSGPGFLIRGRSADLALLEEQIPLRPDFSGLVVERPHQRPEIWEVTVRGIERSIPVSDLLEDMQLQLGQGVSRVRRLHVMENGVPDRSRPLPVCIVTTTDQHTAKALEDGRYLLFGCLRVLCGKPRRPQLTQQCLRCFQWGHRAGACRQQELCIRCGEPGHRRVECPSDLQEVRCFTCGGNHHVTYRGCQAHVQVHHREVTQQKKKRPRRRRRRRRNSARRKEEHQPIQQGPPRPLKRPATSPQSQPSSPARPAKPARPSPAAAKPSEPLQRPHKARRTDAESQCPIPRRRCRSVQCQTDSDGSALVRDISTQTFDSSAFSYAF